MKTAKEYIERMQADKEFGAQMQQKILAAKQAGAEDLFAAASAAAKELGYEISPEQVKEITGQSEDISDEELGKLAALFKSSPADVLQKVEQQASELKEAKRLIQQYKDQESAGGADAMLRDAKEVNGLHVVTAKVEGDANALRKMGDALRDKDPRVVAVLAAINGEKLTFQCVCGKDAVSAGVKAGDVIRCVTAIAGGKGGGKPDSAMGGGTDCSKCREALAAVESFVANK